MDLHGCFDFYSHIRKYTNSWGVHDLNGGAANHVVRAIKHAGVLGVVTFGDDNDDLTKEYCDVLNTHHTLVLKQAPAYIAKLPQVQFSVYRQTIEARALRLFHRTPFDNVLRSNPCIRIPRLLLHDEGSHIIVQSDLGKLRNLYEMLISGDISVKLASQLGSILGRFLAQMQDTRLVGPITNLVSEFQHEEAEKVMEKVVIYQAAENMRAAGIHDYEQLKEKALHNWRTRDKSAFSHGDLWFGSLLVDSKESNLHIGICDWEFAGPNHPAADVSILGAYLHLLTLSSSYCKPPRDTTSIDEFTKCFYRSYFEEIPASTDVLEYRRSLAYMHGWELINAAGWDQRQHMWCSCRGEGVRCVHIKEMVETGAEFLRAAAHDHPEWVVQALEKIDWAYRFFPLRK